MTASASTASSGNISGMPTSTTTSQAHAPGAKDGPRSNALANDGYLTVGPGNIPLLHGSSQFGSALVAPSPITSDSTQFTDVDDTESDALASEPSLSTSAVTNVLDDTRLLIDTEKRRPEKKPSYADDPQYPMSAIYAPSSVPDGRFPAPVSERDSRNGLTDGSARDQGTSGPSDILPDQTHSRTVSASTIVWRDARTRIDQSEKGVSTRIGRVPIDPAPLKTQFASLQDSWTRTPQAQTRQDLDSNSRPSSGLARIEENMQRQTDHHQPIAESHAAPVIPESRQSVATEIQTLNQALHECWTFTNTLANLSSAQRNRHFSFAEAGDAHHRAWKACWALCQNLYISKDNMDHSDSREILSGCRQLCQTLFDLRSQEDQTADSVLRVSFELNNHLFNTLDRTLPDAFYERTLDFYITLCHRLMKHKAQMPEEQDDLLSACWRLAEMLSVIRRQIHKEDSLDRQFLGSTIQACWDLCDLFREEWNSIRPDTRPTPRPRQPVTSASNDGSRQQAQHHRRTVTNSSAYKSNNQSRVPETPTTMIDESTTMSPSEPPTPNLIVYGNMPEVDIVSNSRDDNYYAPPAANRVETITAAEAVKGVAAGNRSDSRQTVRQWQSRESFSVASDVSAPSTHDTHTNRRESPPNKTSESRESPASPPLTNERQRSLQRTNRHSATSASRSADTSNTTPRPTPKPESKAASTISITNLTPRPGSDSGPQLEDSASQSNPSSISPE